MDLDVEHQWKQLFKWNNSFPFSFQLCLLKVIDPDIFFLAQTEKIATRLKLSKNTVGRIVQNTRKMIMLEVYRSD